MALALSSAVAVGANEPVVLERVGPASLRADATIEKGVIVLPFADVLVLTIEVRGDAGLEVRPPQTWAKGPWQVRTIGPPTYTKDEHTKEGRAQEAGDVRWSQTLEVEPLAPGETSLRLEPLRYLDAKGRWQTIDFQPRAVRVTSKLTQPDVKDVRDITAIEELPAPPRRDSAAAMIVATAVLALGLLAGCGFWLRRRRVQAAPVTAERRALRELERLHALGLPERGKAERFGTLLTGVLRRYLERKYQAPARRQTTGEFVGSLAEHPLLAAHRDFLESFLQRCDLLKFAPVTASSEECRALADQARQFINPPVINQPVIPQPVIAQSAAEETCP
ncbi:MAG: hypothetical protein L0Y71_08390 [Gemmataceae bacterium]|nr:hypothetical protein [Gemmataceae bacterium]